MKQNDLKATTPRDVRVKMAEVIAQLENKEIDIKQANEEIRKAKKELRHIKIP